MLIAGYALFATFGAMEATIFIKKTLQGLRSRERKSGNSVHAVISFFSRG